MKSTIKFLAVMTLLFWCFSLSGQIISATPSFVDECLQDPEKCDETADEPAAENDASDVLLLEDRAGNNSIIFGILRIFFALLLVLALIYFFLYFLKRKNRLGNRIKSLESIGRISVAQNKSVQLIRLKDRLYLIGVGENVTLLQEINDKALLAELEKEFDEGAGDFTADNLLSAFQKKNNDKGHKREGFKNLFNDELDSIRRNRQNIINRHKEDRNE